jgi:hypothetical protein
MDDLVLRLRQQHGALRALAVRHQAALGFGARRLDRLLEDLDHTLAQIGAGFEIGQLPAQQCYVHQRRGLPHLRHCGRRLSMARNS